MRTNIIIVSIALAICFALAVTVNVTRNQLAKEKEINQVLRAQNIVYKTQVVELQLSLMERTQQLEQYLMFADSLAKIGNGINVETAQRIGALRSRFGL